MKRGTPRHPKVGRLCDLLKINTPTAVGILELLFHFTAEFAPQGDIGKFDDNRIEAGLMSWFRPKGKLILALIQAGWIDQDPVSRLIVHDWCEHADAAVRKRLERAGLEFVSVTPKVTGQRTPTQPDGGIPPDPGLAKPDPEPIQSQSQSQLDPSTASQKPAKPVEVVRVDDSLKIAELRKQMAAIKGEPAPTWAVDKVLAKLAEWNVSILGFAIYLAKDIGAKYRPGGAEAVRTWEFIVSCADSFGQMPEPEKPGHLNRGLVLNYECDHSIKAKAEFDAASEAF